MAWDFSTEPEFEEQLAWMRGFVRDEIFPLETLGLDHDRLLEAIAPLQEEVKRPGPVGLPSAARAGRRRVRPGPARAHARDPRPDPLRPGGLRQQRPRLGQRRAAGHRHRGLRPRGAAGAVAAAAARRAAAQRVLHDRARRRRRPDHDHHHGPRRDGDEWVIDGHKWFTTNGSIADFLIVMAVTNPDVHPYQGCSMIIVPADTPGVDIVRDVATMEDPVEHFGNFGGHAEILYREVRVPYENLIGLEGEGFVLAQQRLGPGRIHHCMRWLGQSKRAFDMLCERAVSRTTHGSLLAEKQTIQNWVADSLAEMTAARLMTLQAAWKMDSEGAAAARVEIAMIKYYGAGVLYNVIDRAIQIHGALGFSTDLPLESMYRHARAARIYDGPDEVHRVTVARQTLKGYQPIEVPTEHVPTRRQAAKPRVRSPARARDGRPLSCSDRRCASAHPARRQA